MSEQVKKHMHICQELNQLYERKNHDYGDSFHQSYMEEGEAMIRIRLSDKLNRYKYLTSYKSLKQEIQKVHDESIRDTLMDLANYAIMAIMEMEEEK